MIRQGSSLSRFDEPGALSQQWWIQGAGTGDWERQKTWFPQRLENLDNEKVLSQILPQYQTGFNLSPTVHSDRDVGNLFHWPERQWVANNLMKFQLALLNFGRRFG